MKHMFDGAMLNLRLFDASAGAPAADGGGDQGATGVDVAAAEPAPQYRSKRRANPLESVQYGASAPQGDAGKGTQGRNTTEDGEDSYESLIKGRYKADYDKDVQAIVQSRVKNIKQSEETLGQLKPVLEYIARQHDIDPEKLNTPDGLQSLIKVATDDDSLYEDEALERGIPVSALKELKQLEADNQRMRAQEQQTIQEQMFSQHMQGLVMQGEQLKQIYPSFDLRTELQNPRFASMTAPNSGIDLKTAYEVTHLNEIQPQLMGYTAQKVQQKLASSVAANSRRPVENGVRGSSAVDVRSDPSKYKRDDFEEIKRRVARGEKIRF